MIPLRRLIFTLICLAGLSSSATLLYAKQLYSPADAGPMALRGEMAAKDNAAGPDLVMFVVTPSTAPTTAAATEEAFPSPHFDMPAIEALHQAQWRLLGIGLLGLLLASLFYCWQRSRLPHEYQC